MADASKRQADAYVFALLAHADQPSLDPLDVAQWEFYVLATTVLDERQRSQHSITLTSLKRLARKVTFAELRSEIERAAKPKAEGASDVGACVTSEVEPTGVVMTGECSIKTEVCIAKKHGPITAVWAPPGRIQVNVCGACLDEKIRRGEWEVEGARARPRPGTTA